MRSPLFLTRRSVWESPARHVSTTVRLSVAMLMIATLVALPAPARACASGCGVFDIGAQSMFPTRSGGMFSLEYNFMDQNRNWSGAASAPAANNPDQEIRTSFMTLGAQYMVNRRWGVLAEAPFSERRFRTTADDGSLLTYMHGAVGDVRIRGQYTGFSPDLSTGVSAGLKLPTGDYTYRYLDRDTEIGSGSTDVLLDAYHVGPLTQAGIWGWSASISYDQPIAYRGDYRPGRELNAVAAAFHSSGWALGPIRVAPVLKAVGSVRAHDEGAASSPGDSGYRRAFLAPGVDARVAGLRVAADAYVPVAQHVNGNQLLAPVLFKLSFARHF